ncbi:dnaJ-like protein 60 isoform X2 [Epargyreus clarus]|uniref:dnaJ-like protein 60 isoform X2 n=1 Tax=Epargyreus clarus TaxID=520877 RepID=UPI003C2C0A30
MYFIRRNQDIKSICSFIRLYSVGRKSHYDVLNLRKNCSDKEIKEAYIQMSKEYHPDKNKDVKAQERFVRIVEAYNVLGKPGSRAQYDAVIDSESNSSYVYRTHVPYNLRNNPQYSYYDPRPQNKGGNINPDSYYGVKGIKRLPNYAIILICFGVGAIGCLLQLVIIRESYSIHRRKNIEKSIMLAEELEKVREVARGKTNEMQTRMLMDKIVTAANPSVATASLGQALADEKKNRL